MSRIDNYKFSAKGTLLHLKGRVHPDLYKGAADTSNKIMVHLDKYDEARTKIEANLSLSRTGKAEQIEAKAKEAYEAIRKLKAGIDYKSHISQLNQKIDKQLTPTRTMEEKLLLQLQQAEIRQHLANLPGERIMSIYNNATATGDLLTAEAVEQAPGFLFDHALLGPITEAEQAKRRAELNPSLTGQINELEQCDSVSRILFTDAEVLLSTETDIVADMAFTEVSIEATAE